MQLRSFNQRNPSLTKITRPTRFYKCQITATSRIQITTPSNKKRTSQSTKARRSTKAATNQRQHQSQASPTQQSRSTKQRLTTQPLPTIRHRHPQSTRQFPKNKKRLPPTQSQNTQASHRLTKLPQVSTKQHIQQAQHSFRLQPEYRLHNILKFPSIIDTPEQVQPIIKANSNTTNGQCLQKANPLHTTQLIRDKQYNTARHHPPLPTATSIPQQPSIHPRSPRHPANPQR